MNILSIILFFAVCALCVLFGYNEGRRSKNVHTNYEIGLRSAFEVALTLEVLQAQGKLEDMDEKTKMTTAAMLAATKLQFFRKGIQNAQDNNSGTKET